MSADKLPALNLNDITLPTNTTSPPPSAPTRRKKEIPGTIIEYLIEKNRANNIGKTNKNLKD